MIDHFSNLHCLQLISEPIHTRGILDLIFTNKPEPCSVIVGRKTFVSDDHHPVSATHHISSNDSFPTCSALDVAIYSTGSFNCSYFTNSLFCFVLL